MQFGGPDAELAQTLRKYTPREFGQLGSSSLAELNRQDALEEACDSI